MAGNIYDETLADVAGEQAPAAPANPYEETIRLQQAGRERGLRQAIASTTDAAPDRAAEISRLSQQTNIPAPIIERDFDTIKKRATVMRTPYTAMLEQTPAVAEWLQASPENPKIAADDLEQLGALEWLLTAPQRAFARGVNQITVGQLRSASLARELTQEEKDLLDASRYHMNLGGELGARDNWFRGAVTGTAGQLPILFGAMLQGGKRGVQVGVTTGTMGAMAGATAGGVGAVPAGALTFGAGFTTGMIAGGAEFGFQLEAGLAYDEYLEFKDETGRKLDPEVAKMAAVVTGVLNGGLEVVGLGVLAKTIPGVNKLTGLVGRSAVKQALRNPTVRQGLIDAAKVFGVGIAGETAVEVAQRAVTVMSGELAKAADGLPTKTPEEVLADLGAEGAGALQSFALMMLPGPMMHVANAQQKAAAASQNTAFFTALGEGVSASKTFQRLPDALQDVIERATKNGPIETVYQDVETWSTYWQGVGEDPREMAAQVLGDPEAFDIAIRTGEQLAIPTARYAVKLAGTEHNAFFANELRLGPDEMNARESTEFVKQQQAQAAAETPAPAPSPVRDAMVEQLERAGVPRAAAEKQAALVEETFGNFDEILGEERGEFFRQYGLEVVRPNLEQPAGRAAAAPASQPGPVGVPEPVTAPALQLEPDAAAAAEPPADGLGLPEPAVPGLEALEASLEGATIEQIEPGGENASGESAASLEAQSRQQGMRDRGESFVVYNRAGMARTVIGPEAVDYTPAKGETYGIQGPTGFRVLEDRGGRVPAAIVDNNAPEAQTVGESEDAEAEQGTPGRFDPRGRDASGRVIAIEAGNRKTRTAHIERLFGAILEDARSIDASVDAEQLRSEFDYRLDLFLELQGLYVEGENQPLELLKAIASLGGISLGEHDERASEFKDILNLEGGKLPPFGAVAGIKGVFRTRSRATNANQRTAGYSADVILQSLQADPAFAYIESLDMLVDAIDAAVRHGRAAVSKADLPGLHELRSAGIYGERDWWSDAWRSRNMLEDVDESAIADVDVDTSFDITEFNQGVNEAGERQEQLEQLATDEAMGVEFPEDGESTFPDGSAAVVCTNCAERMIELAGNGEVWGWEEGTNPTSVVAGPTHGAMLDTGQGHDFAIIDDRFLVDAWAKNVEGSAPRAVFDLLDAGDRAEVARLYGDPLTWLKRDEQGFKNVGLPAALQADVLETGELQPRLPGAGDVRDREAATPEIAELPFTLTAPVAKPGKKNAGQTTLFQGGLTTEKLQKWTSDVRKRVGRDLEKFEAIVDERGDIFLETLIVDGGAQSMGIGTDVMRELTRYADRLGVRISLVPARPEDGLGTTSFNRIVKFYKRFGFVVNEGTQKSDALGYMYREPALPAALTAAEIARPELIIQHNLTAEKLLHASRLGGLPVPSLAIVRADDAMVNFGEITLIGPKEMAEPGGDTKVFGADVYAPRYPTVHYQIDRAGERRLSELLAPYSDATGVNYYDLDELQKKGARYLQTDMRVVAAFLASQGIPVPVVESGDQWDRRRGVDNAMRRLVEENNLEPALRTFADVLFESLDAKERIYRGFTNAGNRSYSPHTLENVVKILKKNLRGGESESNIYGVGQLRAKFTPQFKSLGAIKKAKGRIVSGAAFEAIKEEVNTEVFAIADAMAPYYEHDAQRFGFVDTVMAVIEDAQRIGLQRAAKEYSFGELPEEVRTSIYEFVQKLKTLPTEYFEVKITRGVQLQEFTAAIVPEDASPKVLEVLARHGLEVITYPKGVNGSEQQRKDAIAQFTAGDAGDRVLFQDPTAKRGAIRFGPDRQFQIALLERANLSTFLHELGHFYLEVFGDLNERLQAKPLEQLTDRQKKAMADYATILQWFGVENRSEITTEHHEKFADGFLVYLRDGRAPSLSLREAFASFRAWLIGIGKALLNVDVTLSPEVRDVFDRMLATDRAIAEAKKAGQVEGMFTTAESAGMDAETFALYQKKIAAESIAARERLETRLLEEVQREQQESWKRRRDEIEGEVALETYQMPVYRAMAAMRTGKQPDGSAIVEGLETEPMKLSRKLLIDQFGAQRVKALPRPYVYSAEGGLSPDMVAGMFGFDSGASLIQAIETAEPMNARITRETDRRMLAEHGSLLLDGSLLEQAQAAIANEERDEIIRIEMRALGRLRRTVGPFERAAARRAKTEGDRERAYERRWLEAETRLRIAIAEGHKQVEIDALKADLQALRAQARGGAALINAAIPPANVLRDAARARIAGTRIRDINPRVFWSASRKAAQQALDHAARQEFDDAITAKQQELINLALFREATQALEDVNKRIRQTLDLAKPAARARIGLAGQDYLDQVDGILDRYDFVRASNVVLDRRESLRLWVQQLEAQGLPIELPDDVIDDARRIHFRDLSLDAFVGVTDGLQHIVHLARVKNRLLKTKQDRELATLATDLATSIRAHFTGKLRDDIETNLPSKALARGVEGFFAWQRKLSSLAREMDGFEDGGPMWDAIIRPMNEAGDAEATMNAEAIQKLGAIVQAAYPGAERGRLYDQMALPAIGRSLTKMGRLSVALNWGNEINRDRIRNGYKWNDEQVQAILDTLDERDWKFVQSVWDLLDSYWPAIAAKQQRVTGLAPAKVDAAPVRTKFGEFRGGYYPLKYDGQQSAAAGANIDQEEGKLAQMAAYVRATTKRGHTKERVSKVSQDMKVKLDLGVISEHLTQVIHDLTHHEMLVDVGRVLGQREVQRAIYATYGPAVFQQFKTGLRDVAVGIPKAANAGDRVLNHARIGATIAGLGWNLTTAFLQPIGLTQSMVRIGPKWVALGVARWLRSPANAIAMPAMIREKSEFMRNRARTQQREINEIQNELGINTGKLAGWVDDVLRTTTLDTVSRQGIAQSYFFLIQQMQQIADIPTWLGQYEKSMAAGTSEADAIALADQAVLDAQGGGQVKDLAAVQRGTPALKLWMTFSSFFNVTYNLAAESNRRRRAQGGAARMAVDYMLLYAVPVVLGVMVREAMKPGEDDDKDLGEKLIREGLAYWASTLFGFRELGGAIQGFAGYEGPAGARAFAAAAKLVRQVDQGEADAAFWRALNDTAGTILHYPAGQVRRTIEGIVALMDGKTSNPMVLVTGPEREQ